MPTQPVVVVGAGIGGLAAAIALATRGVAVTVVERDARPGGKLRSCDREGLDMDVGPTVFTMRWVFDELLEQAGADLDAGLVMHPLDVLAHHRWSDGSRLDLFADPERTAAAIGAFAGAADAQGYRDFCGAARRLHDVLIDAFVGRQRPGLIGFVRRAGVGGLPAFARVTPFQSLWGALGRYFRDPRLRQLFARYATYYGSSPFAAPATLAMIPHVETLGVWKIDGGMRALAAALAHVAASLGVRFRFATNCRRILVDRGGVCGIVLDDDARVTTRTVLVNGDVNALAGGLFGAAVRTAAPATPRGRRSLSAVTWAGLARCTTPLHYHNVYFGNDYRDEFAAVFARRELPAAPTVYVCAADRGGQAPAGDRPERLFLLINAPPDGDRQQPAAAALTAAMHAVQRRLAACGVTLDRDLESFEMTGPADFERRYPGTGGALYGAATHGWYAAFRRPGCRTRLPGLYLAGGSVHPGAGVPMAAMSGRLAAAAVLEDRRKGSA